MKSLYNPARLTLDLKLYGFLNFFLRAAQHHHCYLRFRLRQKPYLVRSMFPTKIAWLKPIEPNFETTHTHVEAVNAYIKYCTKERPPLYKEGDFLNSYKDRSKSAKVLDMVKQGYRRSQLETVPCHGVYRGQAHESSTVSRLRDTMPVRVGSSRYREVYHHPQGLPGLCKD